MIITLGLFYFLHRGEHFAHSHCEWRSSNGQVSPGQWGWCTRESMWKFLLPRWSEELSYGYLRPWMGWCDWKNKLWGVSLNRKNYTLHFLCLSQERKKIVTEVTFYPPGSCSFTMVLEVESNIDYMMREFHRKGRLSVWHNELSLKILRKIC